RDSAFQLILQSARGSSASSPAELRPQLHSPPETPSVRGRDNIMAFIQLPSNEVPPSTVSGTSISEKLQDIYTKNMLFQMHMSKVKEDQDTVWGVQSDSTFWSLLTSVTDRLGHFLGKMERVLEAQDPKVPLPTSPPPLQVSHSNNYDNKVYGWAVIFRLEKWIGEVQKVLPDVTGVCK
uniref:Ciliary neurotrophic factor n=1 Tax=Sphaeramia orbicularis TaxID=375764 RepID=A0A672YHR1_9TELE